MESTLSLGFPDFQRRVGAFLGYGNTVADYTTEQLQQVKDCIADSERQSYDPPQSQQEPPHCWSFLRPVRSLQVNSTAMDYDLPEDYAAMLGNLTVVTTTGWYWPIALTGEGQIREIRSRGLSSANGRIQFAAVRAKAMTAGAPQRFEILVWPKPDTTYTIEYKCLVNALGMSDANKYPYGGMHFASVILEGALAAAELHLDGVYGPHRQEWMSRINAAIQVDKQQARAEQIGMMNDPSTPELRRVFGQRMASYPDAVVTFNSVQY